MNSDNKNSEDKPWRRPKSEVEALESQLGQIAGAWRETEDSIY